VLDDPEGVSDSPAYAEYQTQVIREILRREGFGEDDVPDLLFTNYKQIDKVGHRWSMPSPQMEAVVRSSDRAVGDLVRILNQDVGQGRWALVVTGDSGTQPRTRGFRIDIAAMAADIAAEFDPDSDDRRVVTSPRVTQIWIDRQELADNGFILEQVAGFLARYTKGENVADPAVLASGEAEDRLFAAAFPSTVLEGTLPCLAGSGQP
jgi:hypothetical protein